MPQCHAVHAPCTQGGGGSVAAAVPSAAGVPRGATLEELARVYHVASDPPPGPCTGGGGSGRNQPHLHPASPSMAHSPSAAPPWLPVASLPGVLDELYDLVTAKLGATDVVALCETSSVARRGDDTAELLRELWLAKGSLEAAASRGHVRAMAALLAEGRVPRRRDCVAAAKGGHITALELLRAQEPPCRWGAVVCARAAELADRSALEWLCDPARNPPCPCDCRASVAAAARGDLDTLKWLASLPDATLPVELDDWTLPWPWKGVLTVGNGDEWQSPAPAATPTCCLLRPPRGDTSPRCVGSTPATRCPPSCAAAWRRPSRAQMPRSFGMG